MSRIKEATRWDRGERGLGLRGMRGPDMCCYRTFRSGLIAALALALLASGLALTSGCGREEEPRRIGILCGLDFLRPLVTGFQSRMAELGYIEGRDIVYVVEHTNFEPERERAIIEGFVAQGVDLVLVCPTEASMLAKAVLARSDVPMVFAYASVEGTGLTESIRHPGGNVTGVRYPGPDIAVQRLEVLLEIAPEARTLLVPYQRGYPIVPLQLEVLHRTAEARGVHLVEMPADDADDLRRGIAGLPREDQAAIDAILVIVEPLAVTLDAFAVLADFGRSRGIPCGGVTMEAGGYRSVFSANSDVIDTGRQAAIQVDRVLTAGVAGDLPIVSAERYLEIDYGAAQGFGLEVPEGLLSRANHVRR